MAAATLPSTVAAPAQSAAQSGGCARSCVGALKRRAPRLASGHRWRRVKNAHLVELARTPRRNTQRSALSARLCRIASTSSNI
ncbi:hypothetical protein EXIGLDRAFT_720332 [Exidia glandulosa HHB12029]|uniref:Uncharacterized protein n=1 Tax=Exidia glandulosa HHB12029 TaxID=1314781 RepID=A0A165GGH6_EXIGL|nr:hypothetical protein EXIGLDRAFT_720332 [Exidia glandulosa HHB12029]